MLTNSTYCRQRPVAPRPAIPYLSEEPLIADLSELAGETALPKSKRPSGLRSGKIKRQDRREDEACRGIGEPIGALRPVKGGPLEEALEAGISVRANLRFGGHGPPSAALSDDCLLWGRWRCTDTYVLSLVRE